MDTKGAGTSRSILAVIGGLLGVLVGAALIWGAATVLLDARDADGFYITDAYAFEGSSRVTVFDDVERLAEVPAGLVDRIADPADLRARSTSADGAGLFVGIAPTADVERYLTAVAHDAITGVEFDGASIASVDYESHEGLSGVQTPTKQGFWTSWTQGAHSQTLNWAVEPGDWTLVVISDGTVGADSLTFGARYANTVALAWLAAVIGIILATGGGFLMYRGMRPTREEQVVDLREDAPATEEPTMEPAHSG